MYMFPIIVTGELVNMGNRDWKAIHLLKSIYLQVTWTTLYTLLVVENPNPNQEFGHQLQYSHYTMKTLKLR